jgi:2-iminobutanoate/2-iminopropanoate deaminase
MAKSNRRGFLSTAPVAAAAVASAAAGSAAFAAKRERGDAGGHEAVKETHWPGREAPAETPLFSPVVTFGNMVFLSGIGAHFEGDVQAHTAHVLDEMKKNLEAVGSSMEKVLKVNVYLNDLKDYKAMNEVFKGRFGNSPGVRTTIAAAGGIPGDSLVEIDCIAYR